MRKNARFNHPDYLFTLKYDVSGRWRSWHACEALEMIMHPEEISRSCEVGYRSLWLEVQPCGRRSVARCADCGSAICERASFGQVNGSLTLANICYPDLDK